MHVVDTVDDQSVASSVELLLKLTQRVKFLLFVKVSNVELLLENIDKPVVLVLEQIPVGQITNSQSDSQHLAGVGGSDTSLGGADHHFFIFSESLILLHAVSIDLDLRDKLRSARKLEPSLVVNTVLVQLRKLVKHGLDIDDDAVS